MARSKSWTESQQPENQYTYGQYIFNVAMIGIVIAGLIALLIWIMWKDPIPKTRLITVHSSAMGELRTIPFQANDIQALLSSFPDSTVDCKAFDDQQSFESAVHAKVKSERFEDIDTMLVYCSAIGGVSGDAKPILRPTTGTGEISIELFLKECIENSNAANRILVLDCNHNFAMPKSYLRDRFEEGDDFSTFSDQVGPLLRDFKTQDGRPIWVITAAGSGEVPLYSVNKRRTLFSLAIEHALGSSHDDVGGFHNAIVTYCQKNGGEAAQTPLLFESGKGLITPSDLAEKHRLVKLINDHSSESQTDTDDVVSIQDPQTESDLKKITGFWNERNAIVRDRYVSRNLLLPVQFATAEWDNAILQIVEQSVVMRDSEMAGVSISLLQNFSESNKILLAESVNRRYPGFESVEPPVVLSTAQQEEEYIARAFANYQKTIFRAKYYAAIYDSLSWIDGSDPLNRFRDRLILLNDSLLKNQGLFRRPVASKNDTKRYRDAALEFEQLDQDIELRLKSIFRRVETMHGMTREMAIAALLDSPLIKMGSADSPAADNRLALLKLMTAENSGSGEQILGDERPKNSGARYSMYRQLLEILVAPTDFSHRKLDPVAYYLRPTASRLPVPIQFHERTVIRTVDAENKYPEGQIVDKYSGDPNRPGGSQIDIQLKPTGSRVNLICKLDAEAPFVVFDPTDPATTFGKNIRLKNSDGMIGIYAEIDSESAGRIDNSHTLTVQIEQTFQGKPFSNTQKPFSIPLLLPSPNQVDVFVTVGKKQTDQRIRPDGSLALRPWPNLSTPLSLSVSNNWHKAKKLQLTIYPCLAAGNNNNRLTMSGQIDDAIKQRTLLGLRNGRLPMIVASKVVEVAGSVDGEPAEPVSIQWKTAEAPVDPNKPTPRMHEPGKPFPQGMLCQVEDVSGESSMHWNYWLPVFPETRKYVTLRPRVENNQLLVNFEKDRDFKDRPVRIRWRLPETRLSASEGITLNNLFEKDVVVVGDLAATIPEGSTPFLYVDIDNWPRRFALVYNGLTFTEPNTVANTRFPNASFSGFKLTKSDEPPEMPPFRTLERALEKPGDDFVAQTLGHKPMGNRPDRLYGTLEINCVINATQFNFPDSNDYFEVRYDRASRKYSFPRRVESFLAPDPETGVWKLKCDVSDYHEELEITGSPFDVDPVKFVFEDRTHLLNRKDITRFIFDSTPPFKPVLTIYKKEVEPGGNVGFDISVNQDTRGGVGTTGDSAIEYLLDKMPPERPLGRSTNKGWLVFKAPEEEGVYRLRVRVHDRLGNSVTTEEDTFVVKILPKPNMAYKEPDPPPPPPTHTLLIKVKIGSIPLQSSQNPELKIEPPDGTPKRIADDTYEISGLKSGVEYEVSGEYKMESGFKVETAGKTSWKFPKDAPTKITRTRFLRLEGK